MWIFRLLKDQKLSCPNTPFGIVLSLLLFGMAGGCGQQTKPTQPKTENIAPPAVVQVLSVAAASDLRFVLPKLIAEFEQQHPQVKVQATYGSSGNFYAQLTNKAPFDVFLSADIALTQKLVDVGLADNETLFPYGIGSLVLCVKQESKLDLDSRGMEVLNDPTVQKIAIANPKHAPYGRAAEAALKHFGIYDSVADRLALGESVAQAAVFLETGAADAGIIAHSIAMTPAYQKALRYWKIPQSAHPPLLQGGVILSWAKDKTICKQFCNCLIDEKGQKILNAEGFDSPQKLP